MLSFGSGSHTSSPVPPTKLSFAEFLRWEAKEHAREQLASGQQQQAGDDPEGRRRAGEQRPPAVQQTAVLDAADEQGFQERQQDGTGQEEQQVLQVRQPMHMHKQPVQVQREEVEQRPPQSLRSQEVVQELDPPEERLPPFSPAGNTLVKRYYDFCIGPSGQTVGRSYAAA